MSCDNGNELNLTYSLWLQTSRGQSFLQQHRQYARHTTHATEIHSVGLRLGEYPLRTRSLASLCVEWPKRATWIETVWERRWLNERSEKGDDWESESITCVSECVPNRTIVLTNSQEFLISWWSFNTLREFQLFPREFVLGRLAVRFLE